MGSNRFYSYDTKTQAIKNEIINKEIKKTAYGQVSHTTVINTLLEKCVEIEILYRKDGNKWEMQRNSRYQDLRKAVAYQVDMQNQKSLNSARVVAKLR